MNKYQKIKSGADRAIGQRRSDNSLGENKVKFNRQLGSRAPSNSNNNILLSNKVKTKDTIRSQIIKSVERDENTKGNY